MPVSPLLAVFGFLPCRAATVSPSDVFLFLGFGLYLAIILGLIASTSERNTVLEDVLKIVHINDGKGGRP